MAPRSQPAHSATEPRAMTFVTLSRLAGELRRAFAARLAEAAWPEETGCRPPMYGVLNVIAHRGPVSQREVSDLIGVHASDVVEIMDRAEQNGWIERDRDPADRRRYMLRLTEAGDDVLQRFGAIAEAAEQDVLSPLTPAERETLRDLAWKVLEHDGED